jgi:hypothetical protein
MQRLLDDPELAEQLGTAGRDFAMQHQGATRATLVFLATLLP